MLESKDKRLHDIEEDEIDLMELFQKIWISKLFILKVCGVAAIIGVIVAFSIPKEYTTHVTLAPETSTKSNSGGMGALAAMAGINIGGAAGEDALSPELYPDIVKSTPFILDLFDINVSQDNSELTLYNYLLDDLKSPWWSTIIGLPMKAVGGVLSLFKSDKEEDTESRKTLLKLSNEESGIVKGLSDRISVSVDKKTGVTTLGVTMQDPYISACITDTVMHCLQNYITEYRTNKARHDLEFTEKLCAEAKEAYYMAQQKYARYVDGNRNVVLQSFRTEEERLQNEMNLAYGVYNQVAQQLQVAKAKVQEITPVYTVVQPAIIPLNPSKPSKLMILIGIVFLAGVLSVGWVLFLKDWINGFKAS